MMQSRGVRAAQFFAHSVLIVGTIALVGRNDFSTGVDAGIHFAFAEQLLQHRQWPLPLTSFLSDISHYPPGAHLLGAFVGELFQSSFSGMLIVTAIALIVTYLVLAELMKRTSAAETAGSMVVFLIAILLLRKFRFIAGNEIVANFFFAQFVGTAAMLAGFLLISRSTLPFAGWIAVAAATTHLVGWIFPLNAIGLAVAASMLRARPCIRLNSQIRQRVVETIVSGTVLCAAAILHPTMLNMIAISANDGGISISTTSMVVILAYLLLIGIPFSIRLARGSNLVYFEPIVALCIGVAVPCVLQLGALAFLGLGSPYALKKWGFMLGTLSVLIFSCLVMEWLPAKRLVSRIIPPRFAPYARVVLTPTFGCVVLIFVFAGRPGTPVSEIVEYDREIKVLMDNSFANELDATTVSMNSKVSPHANYVVAFVRLHPSPQVQVVQNALLSPEPKLLEGARFIVLNSVEADHWPDSCVFHRNDQLAVVRWERAIISTRGPLVSCWSQ